MLKTTYNYWYECDRCHMVSIYSHFEESWRPKGWLTLSGWLGRSGGEEVKHLCPRCHDELFAAGGLAWEGFRRDETGDQDDEERERDEPDGGAPLSRRHPRSLR